MLNYFLQFYFAVYLDYSKFIMVQIICCLLIYIINLNQQDQYDQYKFGHLVQNFLQVYLKIMMTIDFVVSDFCNIFCCTLRVITQDFTH